MATAAPSLNGKPQRKQLSDQLDRLDGIIDCLAEALPEAVGDATREGTRQAVREAITDVLTDPKILTLLKAALTPSAPVATPVAEKPVGEAPSEPKPGFFSRLKSAIGRVVTGTVSRVKSLTSKVIRPLRDTVRAIKARFAAAREKFRQVACAIDVGMKLRKTILIAIGVGLTVTVASQMNHTVASVLAGIGATAAAIAVQVGLQVRGFFRRFGSDRS